MAKFTLTIEDNGDEIELSHEMSEPWDGSTQPPASYFVGGMVLNFLNEALDFEVIEEETPVESVE